MKQRFACFVKWLGGLSFRSGVAVAVVCVTCYVISFGQMLLPISLGAKGVLWFIFFGLAKTSQYVAILILGKSGVDRLRAVFKSRSGNL